MKKKKANAEMMKSFLSEALLLLLQEKKFTEISVKELTEKAGVNRSTYYRNFDSKEEIIQFFYCHILRQCISENTSQDLSAHLTNIFNQFLNYKKELLCLHKNNLSYLLLGALNIFFTDYWLPERTDFEKEFELYYHTGGIFNALLLWFEYSMRPLPACLVKKSLEILPEGFTPFLMKD